MDDDLHDIDKLFRNSLEPQEEAPSEKVWAEINKQLNKDGQKKPFAAYWAKGAAIVGLILLAFTGYLFYHHQQINKNKKNKIADNKTQEINLIKRDTIQIKPTENDKTLTQHKKIVSINKDSNSIKKESFASKTKKSNTANQLDNLVKSTSKKTPVNTAQDSTPANASSILTSKSTKVFPRLKNNKSTTENKFHTKETNQLNTIFNKKTLFKNSNSNPVKRTDTYTNGITNKTITRYIPTKKFKENNDFEFDRLLSANNLILQNNYAAKQPIPSLLKVKDSISGFLLLNNHQTNNNIKKKGIQKQSNKQSKFYVSVFAAREWNGYQLQDDDDDGNRGSGRRDDDDKKSIKDREDENASFTIGANIGYQLNKKIALETGLHIGSYKISTDSAKIYAENNAGSVAYKLNTSSGYTYLNGAGSTTLGDSTMAQHIKQAVNYIGIPLLIRYKLSHGKLNFNPAVGLMFNFITSTKISADLDGTIGNAQSSGKLLGLKKMSVALILNPSIYYQISNHISFGLEPYFNYNISPITKANVVDSYPYGLGLGAGIKYSF